MTALIGAAWGELRGWTPAQHSAATQYLLVLGALLAGLVALWYTDETGKLRDQQREEIDLLKEQARMSYAPILVHSLYEKHEVDEWLRMYGRHGMSALDTSPTRLDKAAQSVARIGGFDAELKLLCMIENPGESIALDCYAFAWLRDADLFHASVAAVLCLERDTAAAVPLSSVLGTEELATELTDYFSLTESDVSRLLAPSPLSYLTVIYRAADGMTYFSSRTFTFATGEFKGSTFRTGKLAASLVRG